MLTAAVRELKQKYPDYHIDVISPHPEIWANNPYISPLNWKRDLTSKELTVEDDTHIINVDYTKAINSSNQRPYHFIHGYCQNLEDRLNLKIRVSSFQGEVFLTKEEAKDNIASKFGWTDKYWLINSGGKYDASTKWSSPKYYQEVVDHFKNKIQFIQIGKLGDWHLPLRGAINCIGKTSIRDLIKLTYNAQGILCPVTFLMHLSKAVPINKTIHQFDIRPTVVINGGRESATWEKYEGHKFLDTIGTMDCCKSGGCWKNHVIQIGDKKENLCTYPVDSGNELFIAKCMMNITPKRIIDSIESYFENGLIEYLN